MADLTRDVGREMQRGVRSVQRYGLPWIFFCIAETGRIKSWQLGLWITPSIQLNLALQRLEDG